MKPYWNFFKFTMTHKWYVFLECCKLGIVWRGLKHDMGKFRPKVFHAYARRYNLGNDYSAIDDVEYNLAFAAHLRRSDHHWQYWVYVRNNGEPRILPMSENALKEMLADLRGSSLYYVTDARKWYKNHKHEFHIHPDSRTWLEKHLGVV